MSINNYLQRNPIYAIYHIHNREINKSTIGRTSSPYIFQLRRFGQVHVKTWRIAVVPSSIFVNPWLNRDRKGQIFYRIPKTFFHLYTFWYIFRTFRRYIFAFRWLIPISAAMRKINRFGRSNSKKIGPSKKWFMDF